MEREYDWFHIRGSGGKSGNGRPESVSNSLEGPNEESGTTQETTFDSRPEEHQKQFFEYAGPLHNCRISPASSVVAVNKSRNLRAVPRDRTGHAVHESLSFTWVVIEGGGQFEDPAAEIATFVAPAEPGLTRAKLETRQGPVSCEAEALISVTESLLPRPKGRDTPKQGIPNYTYQKVAGELWRSRFSSDTNVIVINSGHRDFVYASRNKALKLRYICRLFAKELVLKNFPGTSPAELLERLIELSLYTEENLR